MGKREKLLKKARNNPQGLRYAEICYLAEAFGFQPDRQEGSHCIYVREGLARPLPFQNVKGMAKAYQVRQLLTAIDDLGLDDDAD